MDYGRFLKVLALTQSSNDSEALAALRAANKLLANAGLSWAAVLKVRAGMFDAQEMFRGAAENVRAQREARSFGEELRAQQAERDARYANEHGGRRARYGDFWTKEADDWPSVFTEDVNATNAHAADAKAVAMAEELSDDEAKTNWYCFALDEPQLAVWLWDNRDSGWAPRTMFRRVCEKGELSNAQMTVLRSRARKGGPP